MKYQKKPVVVEAWKFSSLDWLEDPSKYPMVEMAVAVIKTLEGDMKVSDGDYIIKGIHGEFYPCKPDIFEETYEPVSTRLTEKHIISQHELHKSKIDLEKYNRTIECINRILKAYSVDTRSIVFGLKGEYKLNQFESEKLVREIKEAGYGCELSWGGEPKSISIWLKK